MSLPADALEKDKNPTVLLEIFVNRSDCFFSICRTTNQGKENLIKTRFIQLKMFLCHTMYIAEGLGKQLFE